MEEWKQIKDYPNYFVSTNGQIKSNNHKHPKLLYQAKDKDGHMKVHLCKNGIAKNFFVHRLVALAFIPNPLNKPIVNHKDENPSNNCADNLEWVTAQENTTYRNMPIRRSINLRKPVKQIDTAGLTVRVWKSISEAARCNGIPHYEIVDCCRGKQKTCHGFKWEYENA